jgi:hypothetical protein
VVAEVYLETISKRLLRTPENVPADEGASCIFPMREQRDSTGTPREWLTWLDRRFDRQIVNDRLRELEG